MWLATRIPARSTTAFGPYNINSSLTVSDAYVNGAFITYGTAMPKHIWTYAAGIAIRGNPARECPCTTGGTALTPPYVGSDYYCETGNNQEGTSGDILIDDSFWDGQQCPGEEAPCCTHPNMPWFNKILGEKATEDIQLRLCRDHNIRKTLLDLIELFIY